MNHHHRGESGILLLKYLVAETRNGNLMETPLVHESSGRLEAPACMNIRGLIPYFVRYRDDVECDLLVREHYHYEHYHIAARSSERRK